MKISGKMNNMKYCKDCKYFKVGGFFHFYDFDTCVRPSEDLVLGIVALRMPPHNEREKGECGKEAKFFEPK